MKKSDIKKIADCIEISSSEWYPVYGIASIESKDGLPAGFLERYRAAEKEYNAMQAILCKVLHQQREDYFKENPDAPRFTGVTSA